MKNKITKLFLALLTLSFGANVNAQVEDQPMPDYVRKVTNVEFLNNFAKEKSLEFEQRYNKAVEIANKKGLPISGVDEKGNAFSLIGYEDETENLKYRKTFNNQVTASSLQTANAKGLHLDGIIGTGMKVGVWDGGVGLVNHNAFTGGRYVIKDNGNGASGLKAEGKEHAAHVSGTVAGAGFGDGTTMGFAYGAQVYAYNWFDDLSEMATAAAATSNPIYTSNHSYGVPVSNSVLGQYNQDARAIDLVAYNAPYYVSVWAAGNDRDDINNKAGGKDLLANEGVAKNTVVVAATLGTENFSGITGSSSVSGGNPFIASFSNFGPTDDFRIKPDIAAKGVNVKSISNTGISSTTTMQGTSMAAPAVTGVFTLWQGYHKDVFNRYMTAASVRALMAHTARETGPAAGPDFMFGWGLIDAGKGKEIIDEANAETITFVEEELLQGTGHTYEFAYDGSKPLIATAAWTDPAGTATTATDSTVKKLVNDIDIRIINTDTNTEYFPWSLTKNWAIQPTATNIAVRNVDNDRDNIEKVELPNAIAGNYKVVVSHKGTLQNGKQAYSLIISGTNEKAILSTEKVIIENLKIYPNPTNAYLNISGDLQALSNASFQIFDISGKKIKDIALNFDSDNTTIDVSTLQTGTYILTISKGEVKQSYKFIKK
ncbi:MAG TPA: S8 family serine peptidase [Vicingaceae bacterium]|nr:S8 family serine peptidase [Vicingaceae bacterium]